MAQDGSAKRLEPERQVRRGRPPNAEAGEVDERILKAAREVFLARGFEGATLDEIASVARAGKPTIYARFSCKEGLFTEVVLRWLRKNTEIEAPAGGITIERRLHLVAVTILRRAITADSVDLIRTVLAEAKRFPELSQNINRLMKAQGAAAVTRVMGELAHSERLDALPAFSPERLPATARLFLEILLAPIVQRALFGEPISSLEQEFEAHALRGVRVLLGACGAPSAWWEAAAPVKPKVETAA